MHHGSGEGADRSWALAFPLPWGTRDISIGTEHAAVAGAGTQESLARRALKEVQAGALRHGLHAFSPAIGTGDPAQESHAGLQKAPRTQPNDRV
jgi:hypothetical protein